MHCAARRLTCPDVLTFAACTPAGLAILLFIVYVAMKACAAHPAISSKLASHSRTLGNKPLGHATRPKTYDVTYRPVSTIEAVSLSSDVSVVIDAR